MHARRWPAVIALAALLVAGAAAQTDAKSKPKYRFKFTTAIHMDWQWPVNPFNRGRRDTDSYDLFKGKGCGTSPKRAIWKITHKTGETLPKSTLKIDFVHGQKNPAKVLDANYSGTPAADVQFYLRFPKKKQGKVTLTAKPTGDVIGPTNNPSRAKIKAKRVKKC